MFSTPFGSYFFLFCSFSISLSLSASFLSLNLIFNLKIWKWWTHLWSIDECYNFKLICTKISILQVKKLYEKARKMIKKIQPVAGWVNRVVALQSRDPSSKVIFRWLVIISNHQLYFWEWWRTLIGIFLD